MQEITFQKLQNFLYLKVRLHYGKNRPKLVIAVAIAFANAVAIAVVVILTNRMYEQHFSLR
jgi:hypothetical protein